MTAHLERRGPIAIVTIDRPARRNAIDPVTTAALDAAFNEFEDDAELRVAVLTGGPSFFCAGTDVVTWAGDPTPRGGPYGLAGRKLTKPVISAVEGVAAGGGFEIALATSMIVASSTAQFSFPEPTLGLVAECGGLFRAPRTLPLNVAREMLLTGLPKSGQRLYDLGVVNVVTEPGQTLEAALVLAERLASLAPLAVAETLALLESLYTGDDELGWQLTYAAKDVVRASADAAEGVAAFKERRTPHWSGC